jgi:Protein of unknown function (DUF2938)
MGGMRACLGAIRSDAGVGVLATLTMDVTMVAASRLGGDAFTSDRTAPEPIGRWVAALARGRLRHDDLQAEPPVPGEAALGLAVHYVTGLTLTKAYLETLRRLGRRPSVAGATAYGAATALLPWLVMYPSWGIGAFGRRSGEALRLARIMLLAHVAFGAGIGAWAIAPRVGTTDGPQADETR